jgi:predicted ArsR family transcriptional regulator
MSEPVTYDKHDESGQFTSTYEPEDFVSAVAELDLPTTADVADHVGCAHRTALHHLNKLEDRGELDSRMAGRAKIWMLVHEE